MWFKDKKQSDAPENTVNTVRPPRGRNTDIRSELGIGATSSATDNVRSSRQPNRRAATTDARTVYNEDVQLNDLKIRARRRLVGALVLLAAAFVILPWVFDNDRKQVSPTVTVNVPDKNLQIEVKNPKAVEASSTSDAKPADVASDKPTDKVAEKAASVTATTNQTQKVEAKPVDAAVVKPTEAKANKYVVHIGIVSDPAELNALLKRLSAAGVKASRETVTVAGVSKTRVRLGPFDSQTDAQNAANKAKGAAKNPVVIPLNPPKP